VTLRHEGLPLFLRTSSRLIEWKRTNCKMITLNKISAFAGMTGSFVINDAVHKKRKDDY